MSICGLAGAVPDGRTAQRLHFSSRASFPQLILYFLPFFGHIKSPPDVQSRGLHQASQGGNADAEVFGDLFFVFGF